VEKHIVRKKTKRGCVKANCERIREKDTGEIGCTLKIKSSNAVEGRGSKKKGGGAWGHQELNLYQLSYRQWFAIPPIGVSHGSFT
jgi:hypothetical protein